MKRCNKGEIMKGYIHSFESLAAVDGEGVRCAVFLSGCPLRCIYCHNPDTWQMLGNTMDAKALVKKISRYKPYFKDDGGVTFSGGEPLLQAEFIKEMIPMLKEENIKYIIDTSGAVELCDSIKEVLLNAQAVLLDLKFWDNDSYIKYTGHGIDNTLKMLDHLENIGKKTRIRTVIVPGINDNEECIDKYIEHIRGKFCVEKYELLSFHTMGFYKYSELGIENKLLKTPALDMKIGDSLQEYLDKKLKEEKISE